MSIGMAILIVGLLALAVFSEGFRALLVGAVVLAVIGFFVLAFPALQNLIGFIFGIWALWCCAYYFVYRPTVAVVKFVQDKNSEEKI